MAQHRLGNATVLGVAIPAEHLEPRSGRGKALQPRGAGALRITAVESEPRQMSQGRCGLVQISICDGQLLQHQALRRQCKRACVATAPVQHAGALSIARECRADHENTTALQCDTLKACKRFKQPNPHLSTSSLVTPPSCAAVKKFSSTHERSGWVSLRTSSLRASGQEASFGSGASSILQSLRCSDVSCVRDGSAVTSTLTASGGCHVSDTNVSCRRLLRRASAAAVRCASMRSN